MSSNFEQTAFMLLRVGKLSADSYRDFMRSIRDNMKIALNSELKSSERELALHYIGLSDNKIDNVPKIEYFFKLLNAEKIAQQKLKDSYQWYYLRESIERSDYYISEILRLISPSSLEVTGISKDDETPTTPTTNQLLDGSD